jgi:hypothetical protein
MSAMGLDHVRAEIEHMRVQVEGNPPASKGRDFHRLG